jgi:hypothetical protein
MAEEENQKPATTTDEAPASKGEGEAPANPAGEAPKTESTIPATAGSETTKQPAKDITATNDELDEKKVKRAFVDKFRRKKDKNKKEEAKTAVTQTAPTEADEVAEEIYKQIAQNKERDYWTIRIRKKGLLVLLGIALVLVWSVMIGKLVMDQRGISLPWQKTDIQEEASTSAELAVAPEQMNKVRIRNIVGDEEGAVQLALFLKSKGFEAVEVIEDKESDFKGVAVVVKPGDEETRAKLEPIVKELYETSSPSAELTDDSDFTAVILYAPNERAATPSAVQTVTESN